MTHSYVYYFMTCTIARYKKLLCIYTVSDVDRRWEKGKEEEIWVFEGEENNDLILGSTSRRSLSHSAHHHAKIHTQSNNCNAKILILKITE